MFGLHLPSGAMNPSVSKRLHMEGTVNLHLRIILVLSLLFFPCTAEYPAFVENILAYQVTKTCESDVAKNSVNFGGANFFDYKFSAIRDAVKNQADALSKLSYDRNNAVANAEVQKSLNAIKSADTNGSNVEAIYIVFGEFDLYHCYDERGELLSSCTPQHTSAFNTPIDRWSYRYDCDGWRALFTVPKVVLRGTSVYK